MYVGGTEYRFDFTLIIPAVFTLAWTVLILYGFLTESCGSGRKESFSFWNSKRGIFPVPWHKELLTLALISSIFSYSCIKFNFPLYARISSRYFICDSTFPFVCGVCALHGFVSNPKSLAKTSNLELTWPSWYCVLDLSIIVRILSVINTFGTPPMVSKASVSKWRRVSCVIFNAGL